MEGIYSQHKRKENSLPSNPITISTQVESCILHIWRFSSDPVLKWTITGKTTFGPPEKAIPIPHTATVVLFLSAENIVIAHVFGVTSEGVCPVRDPIRMRGRERETGDGHSARSCPRLDPVTHHLSWHGSDRRVAQVPLMLTMLPGLGVICPIL